MACFPDSNEIVWGAAFLLEIGLAAIAGFAIAFILGS
jgi:hypothetical protein